MLAKALKRALATEIAIWASDGTHRLSRLGSAVSHLTSCHSPPLWRYLPEATKVAADAGFRADQMLPLVPCRIPAKRKQRGVDVDLRFAAAVSIDGAPVQVVDAAQRRAKRPRPLVRQIGQDSPDEERFTALREFSRDNALSETSVRKQRRSVGIDQQGVIAGSKFGMREQIERTFRSLDFGLAAASDSSSTRRIRYDNRRSAGVALGSVRKTA